MSLGFFLEFIFFGIFQLHFHQPVAHRNFIIDDIS